jgi:methionyl-tRNA formyltransferase
MGPLEPTHQEWADKFGELTRRKNVFYLGCLRRDELPSCFKAVDVFLLPLSSYGTNYYASHPNKLSEYFTSGRPVVAYDPQDRYGDPKEIRCGKNYEEVVSHVRDALAAPDGLAERRRSIAKEHSWDRIISAMLEKINMPKLKVIFFGMSCKFSSEVLKAVARKYELVGIVESAPRDENRRGFHNKLIGIFKRSPGLSDIARKEGVPYFYMTRNNSAALRNWLGLRGAEIGCIASLSQLIKPEIMEVFPKGIINLHPSLLPKYRGPNPWFWTYYEMERVGGLTVHYIDAGEDTGDILCQEEFPIPPGIRFAEMEKMVIRRGAALMVHALDDIAKGIQRPRPQAHIRTSARARNIDRSEPLIDWEKWPIERVWHVLNGTQAWLDALPPLPLPVRRVFSWKVDGYERCGSIKGAYGMIAKDRKGFYAAHPEGKIRLKVGLHV